MPDNLPKAFQSALWPHLDEIRALRRSRKMWVEIAQHLEQKHDIKMTYRAIRNFFVRATSPNRRIPYGMENHVGAAPRQPASSAPAPPQPAAPPEQPTTPRASEPEAPNRPADLADQINARIERNAAARESARKMRILPDDF